MLQQADLERNQEICFGLTKCEMLMRYPGRDFTEEVGCIGLEFSVRIEADNRYLGWYLKLWD